MPQVKTEEDFPRGGVVKKTTTAKQSASKAREKDLFATRIETTPPKGQKRKIRDNVETKRKKRKTSLTPHTVGPNNPEICFRTLKALSPGMLVLGCVKEIDDYQLLMSLPGGKQGFVPITSISDHYTQLLQEYSANSDKPAAAEELKSLSDLFHVGETLPCKIVGRGGGSKQKTKFKITINPKEVNSGIQHNTLKHGMIMTGSVASVEDHGYTIDLGMKSVKAFLKNHESSQEFAQQKNQGDTLYVGQHFRCMIDSSDSMELLTGEKRSVNVCIDPIEMSKVQVTSVPFNSLLPGMLLTGKVFKSSDTNDWLTIKLDGYKTVIPRIHLDKDIRKYQHLDAVSLCILQIQPLSKLIVSSCLTHLLTPELAPRKRFADLVKGDIIDKAAVIRAEADHGVYFKLSDGLKGFASIKSLSDQEVKNVKDNYKYGQLHRARILDFSFVDNLVVLTLRESILSQQYMQHADIKPGSLIQCKIREFHDKGVSVHVTNNIKAFIPRMHISEVLLKHPEKKFSLGDKLMCRVLTIDKTKIKLTHKKSLLSSKLAVVVSYEDVQRGMQLEGFIALVKQTGVLVVFFNNVKGWVPKSQLSSENIEYPTKVFHEGQVVKCYVLSCVPEEEKLLLSFKIPGKKVFGSRALEAPDDFEVGKLVDCTIKSKTDDGFDVELLPSEMAAFLPRMHLSDSIDLCDLLYDMYKVGDTIKDAMYMSKSTVIVVTKKPCFIQAAYDGTLVTEFSQLKPGLNVAGMVKQFMPYGIFVDLSNKLTGLVPNKYLSDRRLPDPSKLYKNGQSVVAKVTEVDAERNRFLMSLRMVDCYHGDTSQGLDIAWNFLAQHEKMMDKYSRKKGIRSKLVGIKAGNLVCVTVTAVTNKGVLATLPSGVNCLTTMDHMTGVVCDVGSEVYGVVLFVDVTTPCVEVSFDKKLYADVKKYRDNKYTEAKIGQLIKATVQLIKEDFVLVSLKGHAVGRMAYMPAKRHLNDVLEKHQFAVGQVNNCIVKRVHEGKVFVSLQAHELKGDVEGKPKLDEFDSHNLRVGQIYPAVVMSILDTQINIKINKVPGRVHITEILDDIQEGCTPLKNFKYGQDIKVKVIGFREVKSHRYLPISHPQLCKAMPDCTLKPSKMKPNLKKNEECEKKIYKKNEIVDMFVTNCKTNVLQGIVSPLMRAEVSIFNLPDKVKSSGTLAEHFAIGEGYTGKVVNVMESSVELTMSAHSSAVENYSLVRGLITSVSPSHGLQVQLCRGFRGQVSLTDILDCYHDKPTSEFSVHQMVTCAVLHCDEDKKTRCLLSLRNTRLGQGEAITEDREVRHLSDLKVGDVLQGYVENYNNKGIFISLGTGISGYSQHKNMSDFFILNPKEVFTPGKVVTVKVIGIDTAKSQVSVSMKASDTGQPESIPQKLQKNKRLAEDDLKITAKRRKQKEEIDSGVDDSDSDTEPFISCHGNTAAARLSVSAAFSWDDSFSLPTVTSTGQDESDSDLDSDIEEPMKPSKSKHEKKMEKKDAEAKLVEREKQLLEQDYVAQSAEDFDRLVMQSPNSSMIWLRYMAFHLETTEIEKARSVAERALKTISFREEQEKLNVWVAFMNLENLYGTQDSLNSVFQRAVQNNEPIKVFQQLIKIYTTSNKNQEAEKLYNTMVKRFKLNKEVWINYGHFCFKNGQFDVARNIMQRSLKSLLDKDHVDVISKFAQMEFKLGESERGKTMFENIVSNYPKRSDLWSIYIDMVTKLEQIDVARQLYNRVIHLSMSAKKMKFFFKKFLDFEKQHGTAAAVEDVKQKAVQFVESCAKSDF